MTKATSSIGIEPDPLAQPGLILARPAGRTALAVAIFFATKVALGLVILAASAHWLPVGGFAIFSQLSVLMAYFALLATAGVQNGLIRQIAAAGADDHAIERQVRAALILWGCVAIPIAFGAWALGTRISVLLAGISDLAWAVPGLALLAIWTGLGQLLCSVLTGRGQVAFALSAQGIGLIVGTVPALILLHRGEPVAGALIFSTGQGLTTLLVGWRIRTILGGALRHKPPVRAEIVHLLGFSGAFLITASIMPLTLLGLRSIYRTGFGLDALGYWLAANRISDVNTQLLGLYMTQAFLPAMARAPLAEQRRLALRTAAGAAAVMAVPLLVFLACPDFLVRTFLSVKFLPATGFMQGYFLGDMLRVGASVASYAALARSQLIRYISIEAASAIVMALFLVSLTWSGVVAAPPIAYASTYAIMAVAALLLFFLPQKMRQR